MKPFVAALIVSLIALPVAAQSVDMSSLTPTLTYPDPAPEPVTQDEGGIDQ